MLDHANKFPVKIIDESRRCFVLVCSPLRVMKLMSKHCKPASLKVKLYLRGQALPRVINLHNIEDDMQTLFARSSSSTFEFKAIVDGSSAVEGMLRYHPFLYDRETFPSDAFDPRSK